MSYSHQAAQVTNPIKEVQANIAALKKILKDMDPASGVSMAFRRGVSRDDPEDEENDRARRPWVTIETGELELVTTAINAALLASEDSLKLRTAWARETFAELEKFLTSIDCPREQST